jgi:hypothetical protein
MKTRFLFLIIMMMGLSTVMSAQEEDKPELGTLFKDTDNKIDHSGYAGLSVGYLKIDGQDVLTLGGRAGWIIDHNIAIGLSGKGLINTIYLEGDWPDQDGYYLVGGYGGLFIEPIIIPKWPIHISMPFLFGAGFMTLNEYEWYSPYNWDSFFIIEQGIELELSMVKFFRIGFGVSYRYTSNLRMEYVSETLLNGFGGSITFKFGVF